MYCLRNGIKAIDLGLNELLVVWNELWTVYDELFADSSALPMVAVASE